MWKGLYFIFYISLHHVQSGSICRSNSIIPGRLVTISGYNNDIGQCECQITLTTNPNNKPDPYNTNITITHYPVDCNNSLVYWWDSSTKYKSKQENFTFTLELNGNLYVLIENQLIGSGELCSTFTVTTRSPDYYLDATCENINKNTETTTTTLITSISTTTTSTTTVSSSTESTVVNRTVPVPFTPSKSQTLDTVSTRLVSSLLHKLVFSKKKKKI